MPIPGSSLHFAIAIGNGSEEEKEQLLEKLSAWILLWLVIVVSAPFLL